MIERLNFYDVYGYLLPGAALAGVLFLPYWFAGHPLPSSDVALGSAVTSLILAYLAGHGVQIVGRRVFPESRPSDTLIISERDGFKEPFKTLLKNLILENFKLDIFKAEERLTAFNACRYAIQSKDAPSYAEQHQGLYALMRGLATVSLIGVCNYTGWILGIMAAAHPDGAKAAALSLSATTLIFGLAFWPPLALVFSTPIAFGFLEAAARPDHVNTTHVFYLIVAAGGLAFASHASFRAFRYFQNTFATTVYITYFARHEPTPKRAGPAGGD